MRTADNLATLMCRLSRNFGSLSRPVDRLLFTFTFTFTFRKCGPFRVLSTSFKQSFSNWLAEHLEVREIFQALTKMLGWL